MDSKNEIINQAKNVLEKINEIGTQSNKYIKLDGLTYLIKNPTHSESTLYNHFHSSNGVKKCQTGTTFINN